jgi:hypothetical protein
LQGWSQNLARHHNNVKNRVKELTTHLVETDDFVGIDKKIATTQVKKTAAVQAKESDEAGEKASKKTSNANEEECYEKENVKEESKGKKDEAPAEEGDR